MTSWEEEYEKQAAREDELYRRRLAAEERRRAHRRKLLLLAAVLALFIAVTVLIVVMTVHSAGSSRDRDRDDKPSPSTQTEPKKDPPETQPEDSEPDKTLPQNIEIPDWITVDLLPLNEYSRPGDPLEVVNGVVVHYVGNPNTTAKQNRSYFAGLAQSHATSASSHFLIGLDGEILLIVPLDEISYCSTIRNHDTIAIECCHPDETGKFTEATEDSLVKLLKWLCDVYDLDRDDVIRHYDVAGKVCPKYYVDHPEAWESLKDRVFRWSLWG